MTSKVVAVTAPTMALVVREILGRGKLFGRRQTTILVGFNQILALLALRQMQHHVQRHIGVRRTVTRSFERFGFVGATLYTYALWRGADGAVAKVYAALHTVLAMLFAQFAYVGVLHNQGLPDPNRRVRQKIVHWPAALALLPAGLATLTMWVVDARELFLSSKASRTDALRVLGFWLFSFGVVEAGYYSASTSTPALEPANGVLALALAYFGVLLAHIPRAVVSSRSRLYMAGYLSMVVSLVLIGALNRAEETKRRRRDSNL